jgi:hypothetical protein
VRAPKKVGHLADTRRSAGKSGEGLSRITVVPMGRPEGVARMR